MLFACLGYGCFPVGLPCKGVCRLVLLVFAGLAGVPVPFGVREPIRAVVMRVRDILPHGVECHVRRHVVGGIRNSRTGRAGCPAPELLARGSGKAACGERKRTCGDILHIFHCSRAAVGVETDGVGRRGYRHADDARIRAERHPVPGAIDCLGYQKLHRIILCRRGAFDLEFQRDQRAVPGLVFLAGGFQKNHSFFRVGGECACHDVSGQHVLQHKSRCVIGKFQLHNIHSGVVRDSDSHVHGISRMSLRLCRRHRGGSCRIRGNSQ